MKKQYGFTSVELVSVVMIVFWLLAIGGWAANIFKLAGSSFDPITGMVVLRAIGVVVAPLGSILGFL